MPANWTKIGGIASVVGGVAALIALVPPLLSSSTLPGPSQQPPSPAGPVITGVPAATPPPPESTPSPHPAPVTVLIGDCVDGQGRSARCGDEAAHLVVSASPCTVDLAWRSLGVDPGLRQFATSASMIGSLCGLVPDRRAAAVGATAEDIRQVAAGGTVPRLSLCYATDAGPEVPCSLAHRLEYVGPWGPYNGHATVMDLCVDPARRYTGRSFASPTEELNLVMLQAEGQYRCAVSAPWSLSTSVWQVAGRPLR